VENVRDDFRGPEFRCGKSGNLKRAFSRRRGGELSLINGKIDPLP
jgi:hypothetical protein